ncbi:MAG: hypothetical protein H7235_08185 [Bdellovibrionaceae bacterium]|nr:hypothetical protein [Pseudobdellovibrionaceae bacterium]
MERSMIMKTLYNAAIWSISLAVFSCQPQTPVSDAKGNLKVLIPMVAKDLSNDSSQLETVTIKNISSLKDVSGSYVRFYYTPGGGSGALTGSAPQSRFIRTGKDVYVPSDSITQQMFSLYYHIQNLNDFNAEISPELKQTQPFQIGLNTQVPNNETTGKNNAFFDGESNALLFVPYTLGNIPISVNSGIIAHEFFHSIFFKHVLGEFNARQESLIQASADKKQASKVFYFNQTFVRGLNEGIADFWGWLYTNNTDFISISLPKFGDDRKLELADNLVGQIETAGNIEDRVIEAQNLSNNPTEYLSSYIYHVGTPHARFLKALTLKMATENKTVGVAVSVKLTMAKAVYAYLKTLSLGTSAYKSTDVVAADDMFNFFAQPKLSGLTLSIDQCDFILKYVNTKDKALNPNLCQGTAVVADGKADGKNE